MSEKLLPPFPVDDSTLDLIEQAMTVPQQEGDRFSLWPLLDMYSRMAGSDPEAVEEEVADNIGEMRDPIYTEWDIIEALVKEVRRCRPWVEWEDTLGPIS